MASSNLSVTSSSKTGLVMTCWVNPNDPLYMYELIIKGMLGLGTTIGLVTPGTQSNPVFHTIYVDSTDPVLNKVGPFTLSLTYDGNYRLTAPVVAASLTNPPGLFNPAVLAGLSDADKVTFVSEVLQATAAPVNLPEPLMIDAASASAISPEAAAKKPHTHHPKEHGDKHP